MARGVVGVMLLAFAVDARGLLGTQNLEHKVCVSRYSVGKQCGLLALHAEDCLATVSTCIAGTSFTCVEHGGSIVLQTSRHAMLDCSGLAEESKFSDPANAAGCAASTAVQDYRITCQTARLDGAKDFKPLWEAARRLRRTIDDTNELNGDGSGSGDAGLGSGDDDEDVTTTTTSPTSPPTRPPTSPPVTRAPTTSTPTMVGATFSPTPSPTTSEPTTSEPTTSEPTTSEPTTSEPTTSEPTTSEPTTSGPTRAPTTSTPTLVGATFSPTSEPTTSEPTTSEPTTSEPTTSEPTTSEPTTSEPTTSEPTTSAPTTSEPTTSAPTQFPTTSTPTMVGATFSPTPSPTTSEPTTSEPTTSEPTTSEPPYCAHLVCDDLNRYQCPIRCAATDPPPTFSPTPSPTTSEPTTSEPTTSEPTTSEPTTSEPTTSEPTTSDTTTTEQPGTVVIVIDLDFEELTPQDMANIRESTREFVADLSDGAIPDSQIESTPTITAGPDGSTVVSLTFSANVDSAAVDQVQNIIVETALELTVDGSVVQTIPPNPMSTEASATTETIDNVSNGDADVDMSNADANEGDSSGTVVVIVVAIVVVLIAGLLIFIATRNRNRPPTSTRIAENPQYGNSFDLQPQTVYRRDSAKLTDGSGLESSSMAETSFGGGIYATANAADQTTARKSGLVKVESFC